MFRFGAWRKGLGSGLRMREQRCVQRQRCSGFGCWDQDLSLRFKVWCKGLGQGVRAGPLGSTFGGWSFGLGVRVWGNGLGFESAASHSAIRFCGLEFGAARTNFHFYSIPSGLNNLCQAVVL